MRTDKFKSVLKALKIGTRNAGAQMDCVIFNEGELYTNNSDIAVNLLLEDCHATGAVEFKTLNAFFNKLKDEVFEISENNNQLVITYGNKRTAKFNLQPIKLNTVNIPGERAWIELPDEFNIGLDSVLFCAGTSADNPQFNHIHVDVNHITATDDLKFGMYTMQDAMTSDGFVPFVLPLDFAKELIKVGPDSYYFDGNRVYFLNSDTDLIMVVNNHDYFKPSPVREAVFSRSGECVTPIPIDNDELVEVIDRVASMVSAEYNLEQDMIVTIEENSITFDATCSTGSIHEQIEIEGGSQVSFKVHPKSFLEAVKTCFTMAVGEQFCYFTDGVFECMTIIEEV